MSLERKHKAYFFGFLLLDCAFILLIEIERTFDNSMVFLTILILTMFMGIYIEKIDRDREEKK